jgi:hypothetical protein
MTPTRPAAALLLTAALLAPGCISTENDRMLLDQSVTLEAFQPVPPSPATPTETTPAALALTQPTVVSVDRSNWAPTELVVPVDGTAHKPVYAKRILWTDKTARQRDLYPTALSALELTGGSETEQQLEVPANWLASIVDIVLLPISVFWQAPWATRWSPDEAYARYWHPERPSNSNPNSAETPFAAPAPTPVTP